MLAESCLTALLQACPKPCQAGPALDACPAPRSQQQSCPASLPLPPHHPKQIVVCSGVVLETCCQLPMPAPAPVDTSASAAADASAGAGTYAAPSLAAAPSVTAYSGPSAGASADASALSDMSAFPCCDGSDTCDHGSDLCAEAAFTLAHTPVASVPQLVCTVSWGSRCCCVGAHLGCWLGWAGCMPPPFAARLRRQASCPSCPSTPPSPSSSPLAGPLCEEGLLRAHHGGGHRSHARLR